MGQLTYITHSVHEQQNEEKQTDENIYIICTVFVLT